MGRFPLFALAIALMAGCASSPPDGQGPETASQPSLMPASYQGSRQGGSLTVCRPEVMHRRIALDDGCLNRIDRSPMVGKQIDIGRRHSEIDRDLCDNMVLPSCRRKY